MKKLLAIILCLCMLFTITACGDKNDVPPEDEVVQDDPIVKPDDNTNPDDDVTIGQDDDESEDDVEETEPLFGDLIKAEDTFNTDYDAYKVFKDAQGKISYISSLTTSVTFVADGEWYIPGMLGSIQHAATIPANANYIKYFDNMTIGPNLIYVVDDKISCVDDNGEFRYNDIPFNSETDILVYSDSLGAPWIKIITKTDNGYTVTMWAPEADEHGSAQKNEDGKYVYKVEETGTLDVFKTGDKGVRDEWVDGYEITDKVVEILSVPNGANGYETIARTSNNDLYLLEDLDTVFGVWTFEATTYDPWLEDVNKLFFAEDFFTVPVYSKNSDNTKMFTKSYGESIVDKEDDTDVTFLMPDGLTTDNVVDVLGISNAMCFLFDNGDIYFTKQLSDDAFAMNIEGEFEMFKHEELSEANKTMNFKSFAAETVGIAYKYVYALTGDGYLYAYDVSDFIYQ